MRKLLRTQTAARLKKLGGALHAMTGKGEDADAIHDLRVSIRRLSEELKVFEEWFRPGPVKRIRGGLHRLMERCAAVRNCDIAVEVLRAAGWKDPGLIAGLGDERRHTRKELAHELANWRKKDRVRKWSGHLRVGHSDSKASAAENAGRLLPEMVEELFGAGDEASRPDSNRPKMHRLRLQSKQVRYTLELLEPVYGKRAKKILESLKGLQEKLGAINDCATTLEMIRRDRGAAAAVRRLAGEREAEFREYWKNRFGPREKARWKTVLGAADGKK